MKLDVKNLRYLSKDDFRVLQAVELGQKNVRCSSNSACKPALITDVTCAAARDRARASHRHHCRPQVRPRSLCLNASSAPRDSNLSPGQTPSW